MTLNKTLLAAFAGVALISLAVAQRPAEDPSWAPKPKQPTKYVPPHKPHTKIAEGIPKFVEWYRENSIQR